MRADLSLLAQIQLFPVAASKQAGDIDALYWFLTIVSTVMTVLIFFGVAFFAYKYRRRAHVHARPGGRIRADHPGDRVRRKRRAVIVARR